MLKLLMLLAMMMGADFDNASNVMTPEVVEEVQLIYEEKYDEIQKANEELGKVYGNIYVGDQRFLDIEEDCHITDKERNFLVADKDADFYWLQEDGLAEIEKIVKEHPEIDEWTLVLNCGMNDFYNAIQYTNLYSELATKYNLCCVNVMPVDSSVVGYTNDNDEEIIVNNSNIKLFNSSINSFVTTEVQLHDYYGDHKSVWMLSLYSMLENNGYKTDENGISYDKETNQFIYDFIDICLDTYYIPYQP